MPSTLMIPDFTPTLTKLKGADPEAVYFTGYYAQGGLLLKQAKALGMTSQWTGGNARNNTELIKIAGIENAKGIIITTEPLPNDLPYPEAKQFLADFKAKYNADPTSVWTVMAADAFRVIKNAIEQTKSTDPKVLAEWLHKDFKDLPGITGPILGFDEKGDRMGTIHKAYVINEQGEFVPYQKQPQLSREAEERRAEVLRIRPLSLTPIAPLLLHTPTLCSSTATARPTWNYSPRTSSTA